MSYATQVEKSIATTYREAIWDKFCKAIDQYQLVSDGDHIAVCISGGKDSMLLAKLMEAYQKESETNFRLTYLVMDPGYNKANREKIEENAKALEIPITVFETNIFTVTSGTPKSPCYLCARMRRGHLYAKAKELGCNKIALGHHYSDVVETTLMAMLYGSQVQGMLPKLHSTNFEGMELIRPLYLVHEDDIKAWRDSNGLEFLQCACRFTEDRDKSPDGIGKSKRQEVKALIKELKVDHPQVEESIFAGLNNLNLDSMTGYKHKGEKHSFLEEY